MNVRQNQKLGCTPVNKKSIKNEIFSLVTPDTQLFDISTRKTTVISLKITFKNNKSTKQKILSVPENTLLTRLSQFIAHKNVYLDTKKSSSSFNSVMYSCNLLFVNTVGMSESRRKHTLDRIESIYCS